MQKLIPVWPNFACLACVAPWVMVYIKLFSVKPDLVKLWEGVKNTHGGAFKFTLKGRKNLTPL